MEVFVETGGVDGEEAVAFCEGVAEGGGERSFEVDVQFDFGEGGEEGVGEGLNF